MSKRPRVLRSKRKIIGPLMVVNPHAAGIDAGPCRRVEVHGRLASPRGSEPPAVEYSKNSYCVFGVDPAAGLRLDG